jgi:hypothetical protein
MKKSTYIVLLSAIFAVASLLVIYRDPPIYRCKPDVAGSLHGRCTSFNCGNYSNGEPIKYNDTVYWEPDTNQTLSDLRLKMKNSSQYIIESYDECLSKRARLAEKQIEESWFGVVTLTISIGLLIGGSLIILWIFRKVVVPSGKWTKNIVEKFADRGNNINANVNLTTGYKCPGWYPDPLDATKLRYWDGRVWLDNNAPPTDQDSY